MEERKYLSVNAFVVLGAFERRAANDKASTIQDEAREVAPEGVIGDHVGTRTALEEVVVEAAADEVDNDGNGENDETNGSSTEAFLNIDGTSRGVSKGDGSEGSTRSPADGDGGVTDNLFVAKNINGTVIRDSILFSFITLGIRYGNASSIGSDDRCTESSISARCELTHAVRSKRIRW